MKPTSQFVVLCGIAGATFFGGCMNTSAQPALMPSSEITAAKVAGAVSMVINGVTSDLKVGEIVSPSATITTGPGASMALLFPDDTVVQLGEETEAVVQKFSPVPASTTKSALAAGAAPPESHTTLALRKGELFSRVSNLPAFFGSSLAVETPAGTVSSAGGIFRISFRPTGAGQCLFQISALNGEVVLVPPEGGNSTAGKRRVVASGQEFSVSVNATLVLRKQH